MELAPKHNLHGSILRRVLEQDRHLSEDRHLTENIAQAGIEGKCADKPKLILASTRTGFVSSLPFSRSSSADFQKPGGGVGSKIHRWTDFQHPRTASPKPS